MTAPKKVTDSEILDWMERKQFLARALYGGNEIEIVGGCRYLAIGIRECVEAAMKAERGRR